MLEELGAGLLHDAERRHLDELVKVLRAVDSRLSREADMPAPSLQRRQADRSLGWTII
jgi:hypothetical protein